MTEQTNNLRVAELTTEIVKTFVNSNQLPPEKIGVVTEEIGNTLSNLANGTSEPPKEPAVAIEKSITPDFLICLEDGKKYKSLKRHLRKLGMTPQQYRDKWGLPADYPMVSPNYAKQRSKMAKAMGLGQHPPQRKRSSKTTKRKKVAARG